MFSSVIIKKYHQKHLKPHDMDRSFGKKFNFTTSSHEMKQKNNLGVNARYFCQEDL